MWAVSDLRRYYWDFEMLCELHYVTTNKPGTAHDKVIVEGDIDGNGKADFQIELSHITKLGAGDFVL